MTTKEQRERWFTDSEDFIHDGMNFDKALGFLKDGVQIQRKGWNGKGMYLEVQVPDENSKMTLPYIFMKTACSNTVPWLASQTDILANDWLLVKDESEKEG
jgi:hypothetical protein